MCDQGSGYANSPLSESYQGERDVRATATRRAPRCSCFTIGVSISFAAIRYASSDIETLKEIDKAFGWERTADIDLSSRTLLAPFDDDNTKISTRFPFRKDASISP